MKKSISMILVFTVFLTTVNITFAAEVEHGDITSYGASVANDITKLSEISYDTEWLANISVAKEPDVSSCIMNKEQCCSVRKIYNVV